MAPIIEPFGPLVDEVALKEAPLVRVLAQVRFPELASIAQAEFVGPFQEAIRADYPILRKHHEIGLLFTPEGVTQTPTPQAGLIWRFADRDGIWQVSLAPAFVSLETKSYSGEQEFIGRLGKVLTALSAVGAPIIFDRFGLRYVNRLPATNLDDLRGFVNREALGLVASHTFPDGVALQHSFSETRFELKDRGTLLARWGYLPPDVALDPTLEPATETSWLLDLDMSISGPLEFAPENIVSLAKDFHGAIYRFFRWAATDKLLAARGGKV